MGGDGVTKVISRRLPREEQLSEDEEPLGDAPPPFAGMPAEDDQPETGLGVAAAGAAAEPTGRSDTEAA